MAPDLKDPLRLIALDPEDLAVVSAHLQDSVARVADMAFLRSEKRFAMVVDRLDWTSAGGAGERRRTGVHFERVQSAQSRNLDLADRTAKRRLLAIEFAETDAPAGVVTLHFMDDSAVQLQVECLEAAMSDLGLASPVAGPPLRGEA